MTTDGALASFECEADLATIQETFNVGIGLIEATLQPLGGPCDHSQPAMPSRPFSAVAVFALLSMAGTLTAQVVIPTAAPASNSRRPLFTAEELDRARAVAARRMDRQESYIRASRDDDVIILAPYIVEGDNSLLQARLRRDLEQGFGVRRYRRIMPEPAVLQELNLTRKYDDRFFRGPSPGAPPDRPNTIDWLGVAVGVFAAVIEKRTGDIFRAPDPVLGRWRSPAGASVRVGVLIGDR